MNTSMTEMERTVLATTAVAILMAIIFLVPWRVKATDEIKWSPIFRHPIAYTSTYATERPGSDMQYDQAEVAVGRLLLNVLAIGAVGWLAFVFTSETDAGSSKEIYGAGSGGISQ